MASKTRKKVYEKSPCDTCTNVPICKKLESMTKLLDNIIPLGKEMDSSFDIVIKCDHYNPEKGNITIREAVDSMTDIQRSALYKLLGYALTEDRG